MSLRSADIESLERLQSRCIKAVLGLPSCAYHSALLAALVIPRVQEGLRRGILLGLAGMFRSQPTLRLSQIMTRGVILLATEPQQLSDSSLGLAHRLLNSSFLSILENAAGRVDLDVIRCTVDSDGVVDTLMYTDHC